MFGHKNRQESRRLDVGDIPPLPALLAELERLRAENAELKTAVYQYSAVMDVLKAENAALKAERDAAQ